jgi:hypothetical protein
MLSGKQWEQQKGFSYGVKPLLLAVWPVKRKKPCKLSLHINKKKQGKATEMCLPLFSVSKGVETV